MTASSVRDLVYSFLLRAESGFDYTYIGPGRNEVPWLDLFIIGICIVAIGVVVHGVIMRARD
jgi:hypothetical protein